MAAHRKLTDAQLAEARSRVSGGHTVASVREWLSAQGVEISERGLARALGQTPNESGPANQIRRSLRRRLKQIDALLGKGLEEALAAPLESARHLQALGTLYRSMVEPYLKLAALDRPTETQGLMAELQRIAKAREQERREQAHAQTATAPDVH